MDTEGVGQLPGHVLVRVLGRTAVERDGRSVPLPGKRERALLAALAAHAPAAVSTHRLVDAVWNGSAPDGARQTLRAYVATLRRALRTAGVEGLILTRAGGYALADGAATSVDCELFERLLADADRLAAAGEVERAAAALRAALQLWRGPAFADVAESPVIAAKARRLEEARLLALERRAEAELACGRHAALAAELAELCTEHPLREGLWKARMLALYRSGRQADALAVYRELFDRLQSELGLEPSEEVSRLQVAILRHDASLDLRDPSLDLRDPSLDLRDPSLDLHRARLVGRTRELATLEACFSVARTGSGQLVLVRGEPGIGKTAFVAHYVSRARAEGAAVLHGRCELGQNRPYQPFVEALQGYLEGLEEGARRRLLTEWGGALAPIVPGLAGRRPARATDAEAAREELFEAVTAAVRLAGAERPVVLVLDDLQWSEKSSLLLLRHLARRIREMAVLVVAICREDGLAGNAALAETIAALEQDPGVTSVFLSVEASSLAAGGRGMLASGLAELEPTTIHLLAAAAALGREFDVGLLAEVAGVEPAVAARGLEAARDAGLIAPAAADGRSGPSGRMRFTHDRVRQTLYESGSDTERATWHRRIGEQLEQLRPGVRHAATLATHFAAAARHGDTGKAARYAAAAARDALDQLAFEDARALAERGLRCLALDAQPDLWQRCELNLLLSEACLFARDLAASKAAASLAAVDARRLRWRESLVRAAELRSYLNVVGQAEPETEDLCREALAALGDEEPGRRARVLAGWADHVAFGRGDGTGAEALSRQALAAARQSRDDAALARALFIRGEAIGWTERIGERLELAAELLSLAEDRRDARAEADARHQRALALLEQGDLDGFDREVHALERIIRRAAYWYHGMYLALWRGMRALLDGRIDEVEPLAQVLLGHARHEPNVVNLYLGQFYWLARAQGRQPDLRAAMLAAFAANPGIPGFRCALALIHADLHELSDARQHLDELAPRGFAALPRDPTFTMSLVMLSEVCVRTDSRAHAATLYSLLEPYRGHLIVATKGLACLGAADRYLGMLSATASDTETTRAHFAAALELERGTGLVVEVSRTERVRAELLGTPREPIAPTGAA